MSAVAEPTVSVVIPAYNMAEFLGGAIASVLDGSYQDVEVIVVNDGSTDETEHIARQFTDPESKRYDERVRFFSQPNQGKPAAVNRGIEEMRGAYFALLDADDRLPPRSLERRIDTLASNPGADIAIGGFKVIDETGTPHGQRSCPDSRNTDYLRRAFYLSYRTPFHFNACLLRRTLVKRVGPFDLRLHRCQDGDYAIRCMEEARGVAHVHEPTYLYRKHRGSTWNRLEMRLTTLRYRPYVLLKNFSPPRSYVYVAATAILDIIKLVYEVFTKYES